MPRQTREQLQQALDRLERENASLREEAATIAPRFGKRTLWTWTLLSTVLIVIGAILAPIAVVANWAQIELQSTDSFVDTFAPLAGDPEVQAFVADQATDVISEQLNIPALTSSVFGGLQQNLPSRTGAALGSLEDIAVAGIESLIRTAVTDFVASDAFSTVFSGTLRVTHSQLIGALQGNPDGALTLSGGEIGIQLGPIVASVRQVLIDRGITFAAAIPAIDRTIVVAQSDELAAAQQAYALTMTLGTWLRWIALLLLIVGVLVARRRRSALVWASLALAITMLITVVAIDLGTVYVVTQQSAVPQGVAEGMLNFVTAFIRNTAVSVGIIAIIVALVAWFAGPGSVPVRLRAAGAAVASSIRGAGERAGLSTGAFGSWLHSARLAVRLVIAAVAAVVIVMVRPLTIELIVATVLLSLLALVLLEVLQRPSAPEPVTA